MTLGDFVLIAIGLGGAFVAGAFSKRARAAADWVSSLFTPNSNPQVPPERNPTAPTQGSGPGESPQDNGGPGPVPK